MSVFDLYIEKVTEYLAGLRERGVPVREWVCTSPAERIPDELPVRVGPGANTGIILRSDTFVELGSPLAGSCALVLWTDDPTTIRDGHITLLGPDIPESSGASLPFGQILLVSGKELSEPHHEKLLQNQYVADQIEGYMIKSAPDRIWSRVSKEAADKGFDFQTLGKALMAIFRSAAPVIESMEIVFVTSGKKDVQGLDPLVSQVKKISREIVKETWKIKGYDIDCDMDCSSCGDKVVCDDIRGVIAVQKKKEKPTPEPDA
jgi:CO dehydrogenase/acetyl-CoA synthase beta subunit